MKNKLLILVTIIILFTGYIVFAYNLEEELFRLYFQVFNENTRIIDFQLEDLNGNQIALSSFYGKTVLLSFWATWCPPCREEMDSMQQLYDKFKTSGFEIIAVNLQESKSVVNSY